MTNTQTQFAKGSTFTIAHTDGVVINETVSHVITERIETTINQTKTNYPHNIYHTYIEVRNEVMVVCESGAVYEPYEINA